MGRSGYICFGEVSNYFKLPNRKKKLLTKEFLSDFRDEIIRRSEESDKKKGIDIDYSKESYISFYSQIESTYLFYNALEEVCKKHNLTKAIYEYAKNMPWFDSDCFDDDLVLEMVDKGIIEYDNDYTENYFNEEEELKSEYKLIQKYTGYNVVKYGRWFSDSKESLEEIYNDDEWELIWLS